MPITELATHYAYSRPAIYRILNDANLLDHVPKAQANEPLHPDALTLASLVDLTIPEANKYYKILHEMNKAENIITPSELLRRGILVHNLWAVNDKLCIMGLMLVIAEKPYLCVAGTRKDILWIDAFVLLRNPEKWMEFRKAGGHFNANFDA